MNKEAIEKRLSEIEAALKAENNKLNQALANINMLDGGKRECIFWLDKLEKEALNV